MTTTKKVFVGGGLVMAMLAGAGWVYRADLRLALMMLVVSPRPSRTRSSRLSWRTPGGTTTCRALRAE